MLNTLFWLCNGLLLAMLVSIYMRQRRMKRQQELWVSALGGQRYWRVNLARPSFMARRLRVMPFESKGVLVAGRDHLRLIAQWPGADQPFEWTLPKGSTQPRWLGNANLRAGNLHWIELQTPQGHVSLSADTGMNALASREALSDLVRAAFPDFPLHSEQTQEFALEKNPYSLGAMLLFAALALGALLDSFVFSSFELIDAQLAQWLVQPALGLALALVGIALTALGQRLLVCARVPARESLTLALMLSLAWVGAALPILKRVDQMAAGQRSQEYAYRLVSSTRLEPVDEQAGLPVLRFPRMPEYWGQFKLGSVHAIPLLRGPSGLFQLDHRRFDPPIQAFYEKRAL